MSITMNSVNHASAADKAAQAAKADFTAPIAANRGQQDRTGSNAAQSRQTAQRNPAASNANASQAAPAKPPSGPAPAKSAQPGAGAQAAKTTQSAKNTQSAQGTDQADATGTDAPVVAPFARMLDLVDLAAPVKDDSAAAPAADAADGANTAAGTDTLPAMITSMLNAGAAPGGTLALALSLIHI